jgi:hypothetical protein
MVVLSMKDKLERNWKYHNLRYYFRFAGGVRKAPKNSQPGYAKIQIGYVPSTSQKHYQLV